jgi:hypothetical protein
MQFIFPTAQRLFDLASASMRLLFNNVFMRCVERNTSEVTCTQAKRLSTTKKLNRIARDVEISQPNLAAELRYFATRN